MDSGKILGLLILLVAIVAGYLEVNGKLKDVTNELVAPSNPSTSSFVFAFVVLLFLLALLPQSVTYPFVGLIVLGSLYYEKQGKTIFEVIQTGLKPAVNK
jgi:hypothetical protein